MGNISRFLHGQIYFAFYLGGKYFSFFLGWEVFCVFVLLENILVGGKHSYWEIFCFFYQIGNILCLTGLEIFCAF